MSEPPRRQTPSRRQQLAPPARKQPPVPPIYQRTGPTAAQKEIPIPTHPKDLPAKYKPAAIKLKLAIVALPVAIVTSYILYKRVVLGEQPRRLEVPGREKRGE